MEWEFDELLDTWVYGEPMNGCGVYFDENKWHGNVVFRGNVEMIGDFTSVDMAKAACIQALSEKEAYYEIGPVC